MYFCINIFIQLNTISQHAFIDSDPQSIVIVLITCAGVYQAVISIAILLPHTHTYDLPVHVSTHKLNVLQHWRLSAPTTANTMKTFEPRQRQSRKGNRNWGKHNNDNNNKNTRSRWSGRASAVAYATSGSLLLLFTGHTATITTTMAPPPRFAALLYSCTALSRTLSKKCAKMQKANKNL